MLNINNLNVFYGNSQALHNVSFNIQDGEFVTVIGNNGAGKTTLMMTISGILKPASGSITFNGVEISKLPPHKIVQNGIAQVPQGRMLFPDLTILENLCLGAQVSRNKKDLATRLDEVYHYFDILSERKNQKAGTLSGGQQDMLAIGRALMSDPRLLILDEPSSGLAPLMVQRIARIIADLNAERKLTILLVEQNARLALELANRAYILESGAVFCNGNAGELLNSDAIKTAYLGMS